LVMLRLAMPKQIAILAMIFFASVSSADVCSYITQEQAEIGAKLLRINPDFVQYCSLCAKKSKIKVHAEKAEARTVGYENYWGVFVNGVNIDLAYSYLDIGENSGISLAKLSGCEIPNDVPKIINLADASMPAPPESKQDMKSEATDAEDKSLRDADQFFQKSEYAAALRLYEELLEKDQSKSAILIPKISKSYYNLGVQTMQKAVSSGMGSKNDCIRAVDYFKQTLFLNKNDSEAVEALRIANICKELGLDLPKVQSEIEELKLRK
ncbi:MAG TPA: hypothetical protein VLH08_19955, partial [Acidobacteriota bacterium]|nr:hypothetical protein [Acidobacteriota bacterium]